MTKSRAGGASGTGAGGWLGTERGQSGGRWLLGLGTDQSGGTVSRAWQGSSGRPEAEDKVATKTRVLDWGGGGGQRVPPWVEAARADGNKGDAQCS